MWRLHIWLPRKIYFLRTVALLNPVKVIKSSLFYKLLHLLLFNVTNDNCCIYLLEEFSVVFLYWLPHSRWLINIKKIVWAHVLNKLYARPKLLATWIHMFSRTWHQSPVFHSSSHWLVHSLDYIICSDWLYQLLNYSPFCLVDFLEKVKYEKDDGGNFTK